MQEVILNLLPLTPEERGDFEALAPEAEHLYAGRRTATPEQYARATVIFGWPRPGDLKHCERLRWFQTMWAGSEEYSAPGVLPEGAVLTSSSGSNAQSVAEHMLASLLALCRKLPQCRDNQLRHCWKDLGKMKSIDGALVLVLGAGHVGSEFARRCRALGSHTVGLKRSLGLGVEGFDQLDSMEHLEDWLPRSDVVALTLPHSPETVGLMNEARLERMKQDAILLSAGRGSVLDQGALCRVLESGHLWGAALDVTEPEPLPPEDPLWDAPNLLLTPHLAGGMRLEITRKNCVAMAQENLARYLAGEPLKNQVRRP